MQNVMAEFRNRNCELCEKRGKNEGVKELGAAFHGVFAEMESSQALQAIFTSIITALLQSLMLSDNNAGAQTTLDCCGSQHAWNNGFTSSEGQDVRSHGTPCQLVRPDQYVVYAEPASVVSSSNLTPTASSP